MKRRKIEGILIVLFLIFAQLAAHSLFRKSLYPDKYFKKSSHSNDTSKIHILAIGDSHGALENGWVFQLQQIRKRDIIVNTCISGNTLGFDNLNKTELNTLKNIDNYIARAIDSTGTIDIIIVLLGTNDCKAVFDNHLEQVPGNLDKLIHKIKSNKAFQDIMPHIIICTPPPYGPDEMLIEKYRGAPARVKSLIPKYKKTAEENRCGFVDIYTPLLPVIKYITTDGVHLYSEGLKIAALIIDEEINTFIQTKP